MSHLIKIYTVCNFSYFLLWYLKSSILFYPITLEGRRGTTDEFATIPFHLDLFSAALVELAKSIPVHSLILSSHLFFCPPLFLFPFTVPYRIVFTKVGQSQRRVIIRTILVVLAYTMLHAKFQGHQSLGSGEDFLRYVPYVGMTAILVM